jgi:DNA-binding beta-propeller fold protein YncE
MTRSKMSGLVVSAVVAVVIGANQHGLQTTAIAQSASREVPKFQVEPGWPKVPSQWTLGIVSSAAVDAQDHIWVLQRPRTLGADEKARAAPPVLEFDNAGNFIQGWGGPAQGYDWPDTEHGISIDHKGFVWITGSGFAEGDDQILKFTKAGKFVMQIGRSKQSKGNADTTNVHGAADANVHPKTNEVFVADGYGNRRVIVFDADTGAYKRMWGAFGETATDAPTAAARGTGASAPPPPEPADGARQFNNVHVTRVSNDGLVYVGDRGGRRVQVFTLGGKYVTQVFIGRECRAPECGNGQTAAGLAFSPDAEQRFLYVGNRSQARVMVFERKTLQLLDSFGQWGSAPGEFGTLHHIAADSKGNLYVAEVTPLKPVNRRIQRFTFKGLAAAQTP